ncbi:MAG: hypothetical protein WB870_16180 [Gallionellaceae bacterium]
MRAETDTAVGRFLAAAVAVAVLPVTREGDGLVLRLAALVFMCISWLIRRDHRGGEPVTLFTRNTSSHLWRKKRILPVL